MIINTLSQNLTSTQAFVDDVLAQIENDKLNTLIYSALKERFGWEV